jgi:hypothetical protein
MPTCPDRRFLLHALDPVRAGGPVDAWDDGIDVAGVVTLASAHAVAPALAHRVATAPAPASLPPELRDWAAETHLECTVRNAWIRRHLGQVCGILAQAGVRCLALKGSDLILTTSPHPGARHLDDIDLLVAPGDVRGASQALSEAGITVRRAGSEVPFVDGRSHADYEADQADQKIHPAVHETPDGLSIEIHRALPGDGERAEVAFDRRWHERRSAESGYGPVELLPLAELWSHLALHAIEQHHLDWRLLARHRVDAGWLRLQNPWLDTVRGDTPDARLSIALTRVILALASSEDDRLLDAAGRILFPGPRLRTGWDQAIHTGLLARRLAHDLRHQPGVLARKLVPTDDFLRHYYGDEALAAGRTRLLLRRLIEVPLRPFTGSR